MSNKRLLLATATGLAMGLATMSVAQPPEGRGFGREDHGGRGHHRSIARFLDLTEDQQRQLEVFRDEMRTSLEPLMQQQRELREQRRAALGAQDACAVGEAELASHALRSEMKGARDVFKAHLESVLTDDQRRKLEMMEAARAVGGGRSGRRGRGPRHGGAESDPPNR